MSEVNIERDVRMALGDLTLQLIAARAEVQSLKEQLAFTTPKSPVANGLDRSKGKGKEPLDETQPRPQ